MSALKTVVIIGSGQMGRGIAEVCAIANKNVVLYDISTQSVEKAKEVITKNLLNAVEKERISQEKCDHIALNIQYSTHIEDIALADLVIECVSESESLKRKVLKQVEEYVRENILIASNTSSISITRLAASIRNPERFVGLHFMNPVPKMQLVELIRGLQTSEETFEQVQDFIIELGKTSAISEDFPAFIVNRILMPMINEAIMTLYEGVGDVENIDRAIKLGAHHPMGPLQLADYIGLDTVLAILQVLHEGLSDAKYRPCPLLNRYVSAGWLGKKSGRGFYDYSGEKPVPTR